MKILLALLCLWCVFQMCRSEAKFEFKSCDKDAPVYLNITRFPTPLHIKNGAIFYLSAMLEVREYVLPKNLLMKLTLAKKALIWMRLPCSKCNFNLDCETLPALCTLSDTCEQCALSITNLKVTLPDDVEDLIPSYVPGFVIRGDYWLKADIFDGNKPSKRVTCAEVTLTLKDAR